jgi:hypothetical protein
MYTALSLTDAQVQCLKDTLETKLGNIKAEIRHTHAAEMKEELVDKKHDIENMLDQIDGKEYPMAA